MSIKQGFSCCLGFLNAPTLQRITRKKIKTAITHQLSRLHSLMKHLHECWFFYRFLSRKALTEF